MIDAIYELPSCPGSAESVHLSKALRCAIRARAASRLFLEGAEAVSNGLAGGVQAAVDAHAVQLLQTSTVELEALEAGSDPPDVNEGDVGELAAPLGGDTDAAAQGHQEVAELLAAVEAGVGVAPHAVDGVSALWLSEDVLELHPEVVIDVVRIAVDQIKFSFRHDDGGVWTVELLGFQGRHRPVAGSRDV